MITGFDFETRLIAPGRMAPPPICGAFVCDESDELIGAFDSLERLAALLGGSGIIAAHNASFDLAVACNADPDRFFPLVYDALDKGRIHCTKVSEMLKKIRLGTFHFCPSINKPPTFSLAECVGEYFGADRKDVKKGPDAWRLRYSELIDIPIEDWPQDAIDYPIQDARDCLHLAIEQRKEPEACLTQCIKHDFALFLMSARGVRTDPQAVDALEHKLKQTVDKAVIELTEAGIFRPNGSQDMAKTRALVVAAYDDPPMTEKGAVQTSAQVLRESGDPTLERLAEVAADRKELQTFVPILKRGTRHPINPGFRVLTETMRTSCRNPNIQNQPRRSGVRECYVARPGYVWIAADYSIAELRSLAQVCLDRFGFSAMAEELKAGRDLHLVVAAELLSTQEGADVTYEQAKARHRAGDKAAKEARQMAKAANFGIPGGLGAEAFCSFAAGYGLELTEDEAQDIKQSWLDRFPEMSDYFRDIGALCGQHGGEFDYTMERTGFVRGGVRFTNGCNHAFQHLTAAGAKDAMAAIVRECYLGICGKCDGTGLLVDKYAELAVSCDCPADRAIPGGPLWGSYPVAFVHDEVITETPEQKITPAAKRIEQLMVRHMRHYVPAVPCLVDVAAMRRWLKGAEAIHNEAGELIPWEPKK